MNKKAVTRAQLHRFVVDEMRKHSGGEELVSMRVVTDEFGWFIEPVDRTATFSPQAQKAAIAVQLTLQKKYGSPTGYSTEQQQTAPQRHRNGRKA